MKLSLRAFTAIALLLPLCSMAQDSKDREAEFKRVYPVAAKQLQEGKVKQALQNLLGLYELSQRNGNINYKIGLAYLQINGEKEKAVPYLERAAANVSDKYKDTYKETNAPLDAYFHLGRAYHLALDFDNAMLAYKKYLSKGDVFDPEEKEQVKRLIQNCQNAKLIVESPISARRETVGDNINTAYDEYAAVVDAAETVLIFTSRRPGGTGGQLDLDDKPFEDIYISKKQPDGTWGTPEGIGPAINTDGHEATIGLSADGSELYIYKDDNGDGNIYVSTIQPDGKWGAATKLNNNINSPFRETHASVSADGQTLYFTSDRAGFGGMDIFVSRRLPSGEWGVAQNIGKNVNSRYDEEAPYIHSDGKTLFFSSKGHNSMGGYDIFFSILQADGKWSTPFNLGAPMNTPDDDYFFVMTPDGSRAYYSSTTGDGKGGKDIWLVHLDLERDEPLTVYKGVMVEDGTGRVPRDVSITVTDQESGDLVGVYRPRSDNGRFIFVLSPGKSYDVTYESPGYSSFTETLVVPKETNYFELNRAVQMAPVAIGK